VFGATILAGAISAVTPSGASSGAPIHITGTGFSTSAAQNEVHFIPANGQPVVTLATSVATVNASTGLRRLIVTVPAGLPVGSTRLRVVNKQTGETGEGRSIDVVTLNLSGVTSAPPGAANIQVRMTGSGNSAFRTGTRAAFGAGITVHSTVVESPTSLVATISVAANAALGPRTPGVMSPTQTAFSSNAFVVGAANGPPDITSVAPLSVPLPATYQYQLAATDPDNDPLSYQLTIGPSGLTVTPAGLMQWTPGPAQLGPHQVSVSVSDGRGGSDTQAFQLSVLDVTAPVAAISGPTKVAAGSQAVVTVQATDDVGVAGVDFSINGGGATPSTTAPYQHIVDVPAGAADGAQFLVGATARDGSGNSTLVMLPITVVPRPDTTKPTVSLLAPEEAAPGSVVRLSATAADDSGVSFVAFSIGGQPLSTDPLSSYEALYTVPGDAAVGSTIDIVAEAVDFSGNKAQSARVTTVVAAPDTTPPTVTIDAPLQITPGSGLPVLATAADDGGVAKVEFYVNGVLAGTVVEPDYRILYPVPADLPVGSTIVLQARAVDFAGLDARQSRDVEVVAGPANQAPTADAGGPYTIELGLPLTFAGGGSTDPDGDGLSFAWDFGDGNTGTGTAPAHTYADAGPFVVILTVTDGRGGSSTDVAFVEVLPPPDRAPPVVSLIGPREVLPGARVTLTAQAQDDIGVVGVAFKVNGGSATDTTVAPFQRSVEVPAVATPGTTMTVFAEARDGSGKTGTAEAVLRISASPDTTGPAVTLNLPQAVAPGATLRIAATVTDEVGVASVAFVVGGVTVATLPAPPYETTYAVPVDTPVGASVDVLVRAVDFAGNMREANGAVSVVAAADTAPPLVTLTAPLQVPVGEQFELVASAIDNVGVSSVAFYVDGVRVASLVEGPYRVMVDLPAGAVPGAVVRLEARALDFSSQEGRGSAETRVAPSAFGPGLISGEVYDDATGLPLAGATVALSGQDARGGAYVQTAVTDVKGRYSIEANQGTGLLWITKTGWSGGVRPASIVTDIATEALDTRVTPLAPARAISAVLGGRVESSGLSLDIPSAALAENALITLTPISGQGLRGLLPPGWAPIAAVDVAPAGVAFLAPAALTVPGVASVPDGTPLVLAKWDDIAGGWRVLATSPAAANAPLAANLDVAGQYAWIVADVVPFPPPAAVPGAIVEGVASPVVPEPATATIAALPKVLFYRAGAKSDVTGRLTAPGPLTSGAWLIARISEDYAFRNGSRITAEPYVADLIFYQVPGAPATLAASYPVSPSLMFDGTALDEGVISVDVYVPAAADRQRDLVPPGGGTVSTPDGEQIQLPARPGQGALPVDLESLTLQSSGVTLPEALQFAGGLSVSFQGTLASPAVLSFPRPAAVADNDQILVVRLQPIGGATRMLLVATGVVTADAIVSQTSLGGVPNVFEGPATPGRYLALKVTPGAGFATGVVAGEGAQPLAGALVESNSLPVVALSRNAGAYTTAALVGAATLTALDLATADTGSAATVFGATGAVVQVPLQIVAQGPRIITMAPANGATNVPLSSPMVVTFSKAIDLASVSGPNSDNVQLTDATGVALSGIVSLSSSGATLTFRPVAALAPNASYTFAVAANVTDLLGRPIGTPASVSFVSLDTAPPPVPAAGSITASIPNAQGVSKVEATQGTAAPTDTVFVDNLTKKTLAVGVIDPNGGFIVLINASPDDTLRVRIVDANGNETVVPLERFQQTNPDGSVSAVMDANGGRIQGPGGLSVDVPAGAFPDGATITIKPVALEDFPRQLSPEEQATFSLENAVTLDFGGKTPTRYINVSFPSKPEDGPDDQWLVTEVAIVNGVTLLNVIDTAKLIDGRVTTSSPPCPGLTAAATYGLLKAKQTYGLAYAQMYSEGRYRLHAEIKSFNLGSPVAIPYIVLSAELPTPVCFPVITGRAAVVPNTNRLTVQGSELAPADRQIVVKNLTSGSISVFPRVVQEFVLEGTEGLPYDPYVVRAFSPSGSQEVKFKVQPTLAESVDPLFVTGTTVITVDPDDVEVPITALVVENLRTRKQKVFPVTTPPFEAAVAGGAETKYEVRVVGEGLPIIGDLLSAKRIVLHSVEPSPSGTGNMVLKVAPGTIDPTRAEMDAAGVTGPARTALRLVSSGGVLGGPPVDLEVPADRIVGGGTDFAFSGDPSARYTMIVFYDFRPPFSVDLPRFEITFRNTVSGQVVKVVEAPAPPRDAPLALDPVMDDESQPVLVGGPPQFDDFDPAGLLTFTFSEAMDADSLKTGIFVTDGAGKRVRGTVRVTDGNRKVTFVPEAGLWKMGETYTVTFLGTGPNEASGPGAGIRDLGGNRLATTPPIQFTISAPKRIGQLASAEPLKDIVFRRVETPNTPLETTLFVTTGGTEGLISVDVTDPRRPERLAGDASISPSRQRVSLIQNTTFKYGPLLSQSTFIGDLAVTTMFNINTSVVTFVDVTNRTNLRHIGGATLTKNPDRFTQRNEFGVTYDIGYAKGALAIQAEGDVAVFAAVERIGVMGVKASQYVPAPSFPGSDRPQVYPGDFSDIAAYGTDKIVAVGGRTAGENLIVLGADLNRAQQPLDLQTNLPKRVKVVQGLPIDINDDGRVESTETMDLAIVAAENAILLVKLGREQTDFFSPPPVVGKIPVRGTVRDLEIDGPRMKVYAGVDEAGRGPSLYVVELSKALGTVLRDADGDSYDDRIVSREPYPAGFNGLKLDLDRALLYIATPTGLDIWTTANLCCDLAVDLLKKPEPTPTGASDEVLKAELKAMKTGIMRGLKAAEECAGFKPSDIRLWESGSSACLWDENPAAACGSNYQTGVSDHDLSLFMPDVYYTTTVPNPFKTVDPKDLRPSTTYLASCVADSLSAQFTDVDDPDRAPKDINGFKFHDISFIPNFLQDWEQEVPGVGVGPRYRLARTLPGEGDNDNDLGLGRQLLLMKHVTEAKGVTLEDMRGEPGFDERYLAVNVPESQIVEIFKRYREVTKIPHLEGHEWTHLMDFLYIKGKSYLRVKGASDERSQFHEFYIYQLHSAAKAGIRMALARMVAMKQTRDLVLAVKRTNDDPSTHLPRPEIEGGPIPLVTLRGPGANGCFVYQEEPGREVDPRTWGTKACGSMEEYVAATAIRSLNLPEDQRPFKTVQDVLDVVRFYRVKADEEHIRTDAEADEFMAKAHLLIQAAQAETKPIYDATIGSEPLDAVPDLDGRARVDSRRANLARKLERYSQVTKAKVYLVPHLFNRSFRKVTDVKVSMYVTRPGGAPEKFTWKDEDNATQSDLVVTLAGGEHRYPKYQTRPDGSYQRSPETDHGAGGEKLPIFKLEVDQAQNANQIGQVAFVFDLPGRSVKEANRLNNFEGFFYYVLDPDRYAGAGAETAEPPETPGDKVAFPLDGALLAPDAECELSPAIDVNQTFKLDGQVLEGPVALYLGEAGTLQIRVSNPSTVSADNVVVCTTLTSACINIGTIAPGGTFTKEIEFSSEKPVIVESIPTTISPKTGINTWQPFELSVACTAYDISALYPDPNPIGPLSTVMIGGTSYRHYRVFERRTGRPLAGAQVVVNAGGFAYQFTTDEDGEIGRALENGFDTGIAIPFTGNAGEVMSVFVESVNGITPDCDADLGYSVTGVPFTYDEVFIASGLLSGEAGIGIAEVSLGVGAAMSMTMHRQKTGPEAAAATDLTFGRQRFGYGGVKVGFKLGLETTAPLVGTFSFKGPELEASIKVGGIYGDDHKFNAAALASDPVEQQRLALLALDTVGAANKMGPFKPLGKIYTDTLAQQLGVDFTAPDYGQRRVRRGGAMLLEGTLSGKLFDLSVADYKFGPDGKVDNDATFNIIGVSAGFISRQAFGFGAATREEGGQIKGIELSTRYEFESGANVDVKLPFLDPTSYYDAEKKRIESGTSDAFVKKQSIKVLDKLKKRVEDIRKKLESGLSEKHKVTGAFEAEVHLDAENDYLPTKLEISFLAKAPFLPGAQTGGNTERYRLVYTIHATQDEEGNWDLTDIKSAVENLAWLALIIDERSASSTDTAGNPRFRLPDLTGQSVRVGPSVFLERYFEFLRIGLTNVSYREEVQRGIEKSIGFGFGFQVADIGAKAALSIKGEHNVSYVLERGVVRGGREAQLENYRALTLSPATADIVNRVADARKQIENISTKFNEAKEALQDAQSGRRYIQSTHTRLKPTNEQDANRADAQVAPFRSIAGPALPRAYRPDDPSGPAGKPHYGLGEFALLLPMDAPLTAPAELQMSYDQSEIGPSIDESTIRIFRWNEERDDWDLVGGTLDTAANTVTTMVTALGLYALAPAMPAGEIVWTATGAGGIVTLTSDPILRNDGSPAPAGTVVHVELLGAGEILSADIDPVAPGVQIATGADGRLELRVQMPAGALEVTVSSFSELGTAGGTATVRIQ